VISYAMQCLSFIMLRRKLPNINRPYRSKWGIPGAAVAGTIAIVSLVTMFTNDDYRPGLYGVAAYYVLGVIYFAIAGRHRLVLSPEEEFALTSGERGVPEVSYGHSAAEQEAVLRGGRAPAGSPQTPPEAPSG
jgi:ethanolamine permease